MGGEKNIGVLQTTHSKAAEAGHHLRLVLQVRGLDGANQLLLLGQPGVKQTLMGQNKRGENEKKQRNLVEGGAIVSYLWGCPQAYCM